MMLKILAVLLVISTTHALAEIESPKEQMNSGVAAKDVTCKVGLELVIRINEDAACVKPETAVRMQERDLILEYIGPTRQPEPKRSDPLKDDPGNSDPVRNNPTIRGVPASGIIDFYINDHDLNTSHMGIDRISTAGIVEFAINGIAITGPNTMIETGPNTGKFHIRLQLPETLNGTPLNSGDIVTARYLDESDYSGNARTLTESVPLTSTFAKIETTGGTKIGREFTVRVYEPDANLDSRDEDTIPLERFKFETQGRIKTTLAHSAFDANSPYLVETGHDTSTFEVVIEIPRYIDGEIIHIGHWYEITYIDVTNPAGTPEKVIIRGTIGTPRN
ncbi:MAG: hypothetical protein D9C04_00020 [Nitrosopumilus sp. B06]|nr:MAG: hypothetical protein D9C04_00020 [Nitrosopumilus sp. B06]